VVKLSTLLQAPGNLPAGIGHCFRIRAFESDQNEPRDNPVPQLVQQELLDAVRRRRQQCGKIGLDGAAYYDPATDYERYEPQCYRQPGEFGHDASLCIVITELSPLASWMSTRVTCAS